MKIMVQLDFDIKHAGRHKLPLVDGGLSQSDGRYLTIEPSGRCFETTTKEWEYIAAGPECEHIS